MARQRRRGVHSGAKVIFTFAECTLASGANEKAERGMTVEAVIWDFGGVFTSSPFEAFNRFEREKGIPLDIIRRTNAENHLNNAWALFERAEISLNEFDELFATESAALGAPVRGRDVLPLLSGDFRPA